MENLSNKIDGNSIPAADWNQSQAELKNVITSAGISLDGSDLAQLGQAIAALGMGNAYYIDQNVGADVYDLLAVSGREAADAYVDGLYVMFRPLNASTGAATATVQIGTLGDRDIKREDGTDLLLNDLVTSRDTMMRFSAAANQFFILNPFIQTDADTALPKNHLTGFAHSNGADAVNDIDFAVGGICRDDADTLNLTGVAMTKQIDVDWATGTNNGGFATALTLTNDTWYRLFVIGKLDGTVDYGFDTSATAANLLDGTDGGGESPPFVKFRQIGWVRRGSALNILYTQNIDDLDEIDWDVPIADVAASSPVASRVAKGMTVPPDTLARITLAWGTTNGATLQIFALVLSSDTVNTPPTGNLSNFSSFREDANTSQANANISVRADASSDIQVRWSATTGTYSIATFGYRYRRGKL